MRLRKLETKDIPGIFEWMTDHEVNRFFRFDPTAVTRESIAAFIASAQDTRTNLHLACVNDLDEYLGTVSLKNIDREHQTAEYAISFRPGAQGTGAALFATQEILRMAFEDRHLHRVYLNVYADNPRACRFYEKVGFVLEGTAREHLLVRGERKSLRWYGMLKTERIKEALYHD